MRIVQPPTNHFWLEFYFCKGTLIWICKIDQIGMVLIVTSLYANNMFWGASLYIFIIFPYPHAEREGRYYFVKYSYQYEYCALSKPTPTRNLPSLFVVVVEMEYRVKNKTPVP